MQNQNIIKISGQIINNPTKIQNTNLDSFYIFHIKIKRLSQTYDILPVITSRQISNFNLLYQNNFINLTGQIRSYNNSNLNLKFNQTKLILIIYAQEIFQSQQNNFNQIILSGQIYKKPIYRKTPLGREITDILIKTKRFYNKYDFIPCIAWGQNARFISNFNISDQILISGRMQSRDYQKKLISGEILNKTTYEISISKINLAQ